MMIAAALISLVLAQATATGLELKSETRVSTDPLNTENAWVLEPYELNTHRLRWVVERNVDYDGLEAFESKADKGRARFAVRVPAVRASTKLYFRPQGPWYLPITEFRCEQEPNGWFATEPGSAVAAKAAAEAWHAELRRTLPKLQSRLEQVRAGGAEGALTRAKQILAAWKREAEQEWWVKGHNRARIAEWRHYLEQAHGIGMCKNLADSAERMKLPQPRWEDLMEPPGPSLAKKFLARAPAKRWGGLFTVRVDVDAGPRMNGRFLIDSGAAMSILSPTWVANQGVNPALIELQDVPPQRVSWSGGTGLARRAFVFDLIVAGTSVPIHDFLLMETTLFTPPNHLEVCCDGILGADFLRHFAVEFLPENPPAVRLWPREEFSHGPKRPWIELASLPTGEPVSPCNLMSADEQRIAVARWDTGSEMAVDVHEPFAKIARKGKKPWGLYCGGVTVAQDVPLTFADGAPFKRKVPGFNVGMAILGRAPFTIDLAHGRLWFGSEQALTQPIAVNESGLHVKYVSSKDGDRELRVTKVAAGSPAAKQLSKAGFKPGVEITQIASRPVKELDIWEVEQRLAGVHGGVVTLQWTLGKKERISVLRLDAKK